MSSHEGAPEILLETTPSSQATVQANVQWVEIVPVTVTAGLDPSRPVMVFREKEGSETLPVWLSPLDAGIAITQDHVKADATSPHDLASKVFQSLKITLKKCYFIEMKGHHQFVRLEFQGHPEIRHVTTRADQAISFCLHESSQFFVTKEYMARAREQDAQLSGFMVALKQYPDLGKNKHPYLM